VGRDVGTDAGLVKRIHIRVGSVKHAIQFEDVAVCICTAEFIAGALAKSADCHNPGLVTILTSKQRTKTLFCLSWGSRDSAIAICFASGDPEAFVGSGEWETSSSEG
jgi:hypothetical protein